MPKWCSATVVDKRTWTEGLFTLRIATNEVQPFLSGQFLHLGLYQPEHEGDDSKIINRPYSVASPYGNELEFFIVLVEEGELTPHLWNLENGNEILVGQKAAGSFTLKKSPPSEVLWLVATGTGLAPYIAMLRTNDPWENFDKICVVHGVRKFSDLAYTEELIALESKYPGKFKLIQSLTREEANNALKGRIPSLFENGEIEAISGFQCRPDNSTVMLCGNPAMLDTMEKLLEKRKMKRHRSKSPGQIVLERYW